MPLFIASLWGALVSVAGTLVGKVLVSLGIGYVTFQGVDAILTWARGMFTVGIGQLPLIAAQIAGTMKVGVCVSMLLSAFTVRLVLMGLSPTGTLTKMIIKG